MPFSSALCASLSAELHEAEASRQQVEQFSRRFAGMTVDDAYAVQRAWVDLKVQSGQRRIGRKIGLTSRAMQVAAQITEPDHGVLLDSMLFRDGGEIDAKRYIVPRLEVELAFVLGESLRGPHVTLWDVLKATALVIPALELIDARIEQFDRTTREPRRVVDTIADNAANAGIILGGCPVKPDSIDLRWSGALLSRNGIVEETGLAAGVLNHPANGIAWLANKIAPYGEHLEAGEILLAGSFTRPVACQAGDTFHADYGPLGTIAVHIA